MSSTPSPTVSPSAAPAPSRFRSSVLIAAMLFAPAAFLVLRGNLSVNEALVRFGCALLFAMVGTAIVVSSMPAPGSAMGEEASGATPSGDSSSTSEQAAASAAMGVPASR